MSTKVVDCRENPRGAIAAAREVVARGGLVVLPTDTVYGLGADPFSPQAVDALLSAKGRGRDKPSPVLVGSVEDAAKLASVIPSSAKRLMDAFWPGALTIVLPAREEIGWDLGETNGTVALRMPGHMFTLELLRELGPLAVSSANLTAEHPAANVEQAREQLGEKVALYLDGGECGGGEPSTIVVISDVPGAGVQIVRHGAIPDADIAAALGE
ncbi:threonylcarbamoyl-AMP synthase [Arcanobacterium haemolyticum]|nr:threonylcarbamoyl-AMP synthase [Arcanobacterium haemolyticum]